MAPSLAPDIRQLPYLLQLADDESETVRNAVLQEVLRYGPRFEASLEALEPPADPGQRAALQTMIDAHFARRLRDAWPGWLRLVPGNSKLETAFELLAEYQLKLGYTTSLKDLLDTLAEEYDACYKQRNALSLANFLFKRKQLCGARKDYYNPRNSNLIYVIHARRGLPISLASVYILVGHRLGLSIEGCNFPMHFLARTVVRGHTLLVDCFNGGRIVQPNEVGVLNRRLPRQLQKLIAMQIDAEVLISRVLRNLVRAYQEAADTTSRDLMRDLLDDLQRRRSER